MKVKLVKKIILGLAVVTSIESAFAKSTASAPMQVECAPVTATERIKNKNKRIKTHTALYWKLLVPQLEKSLPKSLLVKGVVIGDFHYSNIGIYYNFDTTKSELVLNDLDDAGTNYLVGDLLKYFSFLRTEEVEIEQKGKKKDKKVTGKDLYDLEKVFNAYIDGLRNKTRSTPPAFQSAMAVPQNKAVEKFNKELGKELAKFAKVEELDAKLLPIANDLQKANPVLSTNTILAKKFEVNDSGSSVGQKRFTFLIEKQSPGHPKAVIEFKQLTCAASNLNRSQDLSQIPKTVSAYLNQQSSSAVLPFVLPANESLVKSGKEVYLLRMKQPNYMEKVVETCTENNQLQELAELFAYLLGQFHSKSANNVFVDELAKSSELIFKTCHESQKAFLEETEIGK